MVLPEGFSLPLVYFVPLLLVVGVVGGLLYREEPNVSERTIVALAPWIVVGSGLHALHQVNYVPSAIRPLFGTPLVYLSTFVVAGTVWLFALYRSRPAVRLLASSGVVTAVLVVAVAFWYGITQGELSLFWPFVALVAAVALTGLMWAGTHYFYPDVAVITGAVGVLTLFGHTVDGVSTAVGIDVLQFGERTPISQIILELASVLPTADVIGVGWLFVLVKLVLAEFVVLLFADYVSQEPTEGYLLLGLVAAVGLGPGVYNLILFAIAG